jgi:acylglycerol lipase
MGGAEVLTWINEGAGDLKKHIRGYLLESPFVAFNAQSKPSHFTVVMGRLLGRILPNRQMVFKLDAKLISRDPDTVHQFETDPLCHDTGTLEGLAGNLDRANGLNDGMIPIPSHAAEVYKNDGGRTKIFLSHGTGDGICDYHGTEGVYQRLDAVDDKVLKLYDGWYHRRKLFFDFSLFFGLILAQFTPNLPQIGKHILKISLLGCLLDWELVLKIQSRLREKFQSHQV